MDTKVVQACKVMPKAALGKNKGRQKLISEIKIHKSLINQHIVRFEHVFEDEVNVYLLLELCTNGTLNELLKRRKRVTEIEAQCYMNQLLICMKGI